MKKLILLSCILCGFALLSCSKFLEENPRDQIPEEDAYDNATSAYLNTVATLYNYVGGYSDSQGLQGTYRLIWRKSGLSGPCITIIWSICSDVCR